MHDITDPVRHAVDHERLLRVALNAAAEVDVTDRLDQIRASTQTVVPLWPFALAAGIGIGLILAGLLMLSQQPASHVPAPTTAPLEA